jgi:hypothetical protein
MPAQSADCDVALTVPLGLLHLAVTRRGEADTSKGSTAVYDAEGRLAVV